MRTLHRLFTILQNPLFFCCLLLLPISALAQKNASANATSAPDWKLSTTVGGVELYYRIAACGSQKIALLKFVNTNNKAVTISWNEAFDVSGANGTAKRSGQAKKQLVVAPGKTEQVDCQTDPQKGMVARPAQETPVSTEDVSDFRFTNVTVTK
ncbi:hypothetical protein [Flavisolibacter ginsenosidimutans]|uniref:CBM2 domain-containing protein n=1 Tax=Flavisolibacter ginsenosidimutans TaxID=661481 RepID=A0A5B8UNF1_9BACT|nr:hypothetical protein [Flavisolibacter ginsenosidimutans]QEC58108.1 hypothetical protein FSB75_20085 [Flavisolibacter ginsenosidimutans]